MEFGLIFAASVLVLGMAAAAGAESGAEGGANGGNPRVAFETSKGRIVVELFADKAPRSVENFLAYVHSGHYDGTVFHRVIPGFMIQGGGFTPDMSQKPTRAPIQNEADNGLSNRRGTLSMARTGEPHSASSQFYVNLVDNSGLDHRDKSPQGWGYAVFGQVVEGMDVVDAIAGVRTGTRSFHQNVPVEPVVVQKAEVVAAAGG